MITIYPIINLLSPDYHAASHLAIAQLVSGNHPLGFQYIICFGSKTKSLSVVL